MLKIKKIDPELISDADIYLFFEKGMTGGVSYTSCQDLLGIIKEDVQSESDC